MRKTYKVGALGRNDVKLTALVDGERLTNFRLREFENADGLAMVHSTTLESLERVRCELCAMAGEDVWVIITDAVRTQRELNRLAARLAAVTIASCRLGV